MSNYKIPATVEAQISHLSNLIREVHYSGDDSSVVIYRNIIRAHIQETLNQTFPLLSQELDNLTKKRIIDEFMKAHGSEAAEFHKIATELICFIKDNNYLEGDLLCLIEYEWILYHIEISDGVKHTESTAKYFSEEICRPNMNLKLNPTLKFIKLPFLIQNSVPLMDQSGDYVYGIFKNSKNEILRKKLLTFDLSILSYIVDQGISLVADIEKLTGVENKQYLHKWIIENSTEEFISLN